MSKKFDGFLGVRVEEKKKTKFVDWCRKKNLNYHQIIRDVVEGVPEGKVKISKELKGLYNDA